MKRIPSLLAVAVLSFLALVLLPAVASAAEKRSRVVSVDYVIALLDAGVDQDAILERIETDDLTFRIAPGDIDLLVAAGADDDLLDAVENREVEQPEHRPYGGYAYPGYYGFAYSYGYPYAYYGPSYYYPYRSYIYYSGPRFHHGRPAFRTVPRGGSFRGAPRGSVPRSAPRGSVPRSAPRGSRPH